MAITVIPNKIQRIWEVWNLRGVVLTSLLCQILLICCGSMRKRKANNYVYIVVWSAYLLADWVAAFAVGLIASTQGEKCEKVTVNDALEAFWAPFLLLHLGGPDTITAFSLEDNELWIRHMLGLMVQLLAVAYIFSQSIPNDFWLPTVLVFFAGSIKYAERTRALYLACLGNFKDSMCPEPAPGPNYKRLMEEYVSKQLAHVPSYFHRVPEPVKVARACTPECKQMNEVQSIKSGYRFFSIFKGLVVDLSFTTHQCNSSRMFFLNLRPHEAFKVMEIELNFLFDALFTKMEIVHKATGYIFHFTCTALIVSAFVLFTMHNKHNINQFDIMLTQALLVGAIFLDFIALIRLIFSDWTIALLGHLNEFVFTIQKRISSSNRWSKSVCQQNFISYCLKKQSRLWHIADFFRFEETLEEVLYKREQKLEEDLVEFIFHELKVKALRANGTKLAKEIGSARGEWTLLDLINNDVSIPVSILSSVSEDVDYDQSVLTWHIATELCFFTTNGIIDEHRQQCKLLSDYLLYLLIMRPTMMSSVASLAKIKFLDTCEEAIKFFFRSQSNSTLKKENEACEKLLAVNAVVKPAEVKGEGSKSVLFDACILAKELQNLGNHMWKIMRKVWLELLCYAASHCRGDVHAQQLSKGGELVTFVWLLMAHFGYGDHFKIENRYATVKLIVEK